MIIKILPIPIETEGRPSVENIKYEKDRAFVTTKDGRYQRVVSLTDDLAAEIAKGHIYFNAVNKGGKLHITGTVVASF